MQGTRFMKTGEYVSLSQEKLILETYSFIHKVISRKLGIAHKGAVEDVKQKVFLKLWRWKLDQATKDLTVEEWRKMACTTARNEIVDYFRKKDNRHIPFSQIETTETECAFFNIESSEIIPGNSVPEIRSLLCLVWIAAQALTLKQKYAYFFQFHDFLIEFLMARCCSIEELANYFELSEKELSGVIEQLPLSNEQIAEMTARKTGQECAPSKVWLARTRGKRKLASILKDFIFNERTFNQGRDRTAVKKSAARR